MLGDTGSIWDDNERGKLVEREYGKDGLAKVNPYIAPGQAWQIVLMPMGGWDLNSAHTERGRPSVRELSKAKCALHRKQTTDELKTVNPSSQGS